jgi:hypothetical protein
MVCRGDVHTGCGEMVCRGDVHTGCGERTDEMVCRGDVHTETCTLGVDGVQGRCTHSGWVWGEDRRMMNI